MIPLVKVRRKLGAPKTHPSCSQEAFFSHFEESTSSITFLGTSENLFIETSPSHADDLAKVLEGQLAYRFRSALGFSPLKLFYFRFLQMASGRTDAVEIRINAATGKKTKTVAEEELVAETRFLFPTVQGKDVKPFSTSVADYCLPVPYCSVLNRMMASAELMSDAPFLWHFYSRHMRAIAKETQREDGRLVAEEWFYPLRVGPYQWAPWKVLVHENGKWAAAVVGSSKTPWGESKMTIAGPKCRLISQRPDGAFISEDEAHFIAGVLNFGAHKYAIENCNSERGFSLSAPPLRLPQFDAASPAHRAVVDFSKAAHESGGKFSQADLDSLVRAVFDQG